MLNLIKKNELERTIYTTLGLISIIWIVELVNLFMNHKLVKFGIYPRTINGLIGIPLSPLIHGSIWHAVSNTVPLFVLSGFMFIVQKDRFWLITTLIVIFSGILIWGFSRNSYHIGSSGLIFGYFGAIIMHAGILRDLKSILISFLTLVLYGGTIVMGLLPMHNFTSYESHVFGLLTGLGIIYVLEKKYTVHTNKK
jgi:membrane associated rhomboid family serine protease